MILAFIICKVLIKNIEHISVSYGLNIPKNQESDTILGQRTRQVYVKFDDYNFYLELIVYYSYYSTLTTGMIKNVRNLSFYDLSFIIK